MDKKRLKVALAVLDAVKIKFPETKKFIDDTMEDECQKEKISAEEVIFFTSQKNSELAQKNVFCFAVSMLRDIVLSYIRLVIIFTCVLFRFSLPKAFEILY